MDIFNRKKLAAAEAEIERLEKACAKFQSDITEAENIAKRYKREIDEVRSSIEEKQKEKDEKVFKTKIEELNKKLVEAEATISDLKLCLEQSEDIASIEDTVGTVKKASYKIRREVVNGKLGEHSNKEKRYEKYMASIYKSSKSFFTSNELKFYDLLSPLAQSHGHPNLAPGFFG